MNEKVLIIGGNSFLGVNLKNWIKNNSKSEVWTTTRRISNTDENVVFCPTDSNLEEIIDKLQPTKIINCIGISDYNNSEKFKLKTLESNILVPYKIFEAARLYSQKSKIINLGSIKEFDHIDFYSASKRAAREIVYCYKNVYNMWISQLYLSNISGPGQNIERFIIPKIVNFFNNLKNNPDFNEKLKLGNIESEIKLLDVESATKLIWSSFNDQSVPYLIDGFKITIKDFLNKVFNKIDKNYQDYIEVDQELFRPTTFYSEFLEMSGLKLRPRGTLDQTIDKILNF